MAGGLSVNPKLKVSGSGTVGAPPDAMNALRWRANSHPTVQVIDAEIAAVSAKKVEAITAFDEQLKLLDAKRDATVRAAVREMVG